MCDKGLTALPLAQKAPDAVGIPLIWEHLLKACARASLSTFTTHPPHLLDNYEMPKLSTTEELPETYNAK